MGTLRKKWGGYVVLGSTRRTVQHESDKHRAFFEVPIVLSDGDLGGGGENPSDKGAGGAGEKRSPFRSFAWAFSLLVATLSKCGINTACNYFVLSSHHVPVLVLVSQTIKRSILPNFWVCYYVKNRTVHIG